MLFKQFLSIYLFAVEEGEISGGCLILIQISSKSRIISALNVKLLFLMDITRITVETGGW